jgi:hypothetical protein
MKLLALLRAFWTLDKLDRLDYPKRPRYFRRGQLVDVELADEYYRIYLEAGRVIRRLGTFCGTGFGAQPEIWYLVELDDSGNQVGIPKGQHPSQAPIEEARQRAPQPDSNF